MLQSVKSTNRYPYIALCELMLERTNSRTCERLWTYFIFIAQKLVRTPLLAQIKDFNIFDNIRRKTRETEVRGNAIITITPFPQCICGTVGRINLHETPQLFSDSQLRKIMEHEQPQSDVNDKKKFRKWKSPLLSASDRYRQALGPFVGAQNSVWFALRRQGADW